MASQINGPLNANASIVAEQRRAQGTQVRDAAQERNSQAKAPVSPDETVTFSDTASHLRSLEKQLADQPIVNQEKVNAVKQAIQSGNFQVDATRVAEKMMQFEGLLNKKLES